MFFCCSAFNAEQQSGAEMQKIKYDKVRQLDKIVFLALGLILVALVIQMEILNWINNRNISKMSEVLLDRVVNVIEKNEQDEKDMIASLKEDYIVRAKAVAYIINANPEAEKDVDELIEKGEPKISAILEVIRRYIKVCTPIHFDGNGYSDEWKAEAARRGLDCETSVPVIFDNYLKPESIRMFESIGVMTKKELEARNEVKWEMYTKKIQIEARVLGDLAMNHIIPVATQYQSDLIDNVYKMKDLFPAEKAAKLSAKNLELIEEIADRTAFIKEHVDAMIEARKVANKIESEREKAIAYHDNIVPMMEEIRYHIDKLELIVDNQMWTLPKYRELLFIR